MRHLPPAMSRTARDSAVDEERPPSVTLLLWLLGLLVILGVAGTTASILSAKGTAAASERDVAANRALLARLAELEEQNGVETEQHRVRNELIHADLCRLVYAVIEAVPTLASRGIQPCAEPILQPPLNDPPTVRD